MDWYVKVLRNYVEFSGRARRTEFWMYTLITIIVSIVLQIVDAVLGAGKLLSLLYSLAVFLPSIAVIVRRLHDTGRSGWWYFIGLIPFVGWIVMLVFLCSEGDTGPNRYGEDPK